MRQSRQNRHFSQSRLCWACVITTLLGLFLCVLASSSPTYAATKEAPLPLAPSGPSQMPADNKVDKEKKATTTKTSPTPTRTTSTKTTAARTAPNPTPQQIVPQKEIAVQIYPHKPLQIEVQPVIIDNRRVDRKFNGYEVRLSNTSASNLLILHADITPSFSGEQAEGLRRSDLSDFATAKPPSRVEAQTKTVKLEANEKKVLEQFKNEFGPDLLAQDAKSTTLTLVPKAVQHAVVRVTYKNTKTSEIGYLEQAFDVKLEDLGSQVGNKFSPLSPSPVPDFMQP